MPPVSLPNGVLPNTRTLTATELLTGARFTQFRFDLLGWQYDDNEVLNKEAELGTLDGVEAGSVSWETWSAIKGGGSITVRDTGQVVDWLTTRIRIMTTIAGVGGEGEITTACGVWVPAAPVEDWDSTGRSWSIEVLDKNSLLDQDIVTDENGHPITFSIPPGTNIIQTVRDLIAGVGETSQAIEDDPKVTGEAPLTWEVGTSRLQIINQLLTGAGFASLWCDGWGNYRTQQYVEPKDRVPVYTLVQPLVSGPRSVVDPAWKHDQDIYGIPNRMIVIGEGTDEVPALTVTVTNEDPTSPYSYQRRGRWITVVDSGVSAVDEAALLGYARRRMTNLTTVANDATIQHLYLPELTVDSVVEFADSHGVVSSLFQVRKTDLNLNSLELHTTELREVSGVDLQEEVTRR